MGPDWLVLGSALLAGLLGGVHCAAMCGGIATAFPAMRGTAVTWAGSIIVASTSRNVASRPRHWSRENAYATGTLEATTPIVATTA